jgi:hypothetical protein
MYDEAQTSSWLASCDVLLTKALIVQQARVQLDVPDSTSTCKPAACLSPGVRCLTLLLKMLSNPPAPEQCSAACCICQCRCVLLQGLWLAQQVSWQHGNLLKPAPQNKQHSQWRLVGFHDELPPSHQALPACSQPLRKVGGSTRSTHRLQARNGMCILHKESWATATNRVSAGFADVART